MKEAGDQEFIEYEEVLATFNPSDRAVLKSILDAEGIDYFLQGEHVSTYIFHAVPVRLLVRKDQAARARELLHDFETKSTFGGLGSRTDKNH